MIRRPPRSTRTDTLFPDTTLFRSLISDTWSQPFAREVPQLVVVQPLACPFYRRLRDEIRIAPLPPVGIEQAKPGLYGVIRIEQQVRNLVIGASGPRLRSDARSVGKECVSTCRYRLAPCP